MEMEMEMEMEMNVLSSETYPKTTITEHYTGLYGGPYGAKKYCFTVLVHGQSILTTVTDVPWTVREWVTEEAAKRPPPRHFGFEVEVDVKTHRLGTIQICTPERCLIFQLVHEIEYLPPSLLNFFRNQENVLVGTYIVYKIGLLRASFPFVGDMHLAEIAMDSPLVKELKHKELDSMGLGAVDTNWDRLPHRLTAEQVHYACLDAFLNLQASRVRVPLRLER